MPRAAVAACWGRRLLVLSASHRLASRPLCSSHHCYGGASTSSSSSSSSKRPRSPTLSRRQQDITTEVNNNKGYDSVAGYAKIDYAREARTGLPEVIYGEGKTPEQLLAILKSMGARRRQTEAGGGRNATTTTPATGIILATRVSAEKYAALRALMAAGEEGVLEAYGHLEYLPTPRLLVLRDTHPSHGHDAPAETIGTVTILCAGTADLSVAEEAAVVAELCGAKVHRLYDVGIAGIHRLFASLDTVRRSHACVAVAGMDGALPTVVAGLVQAPVIAVPTSVGYGIGANGIAPLMTMLNACAPGVAVVNIDNGLGAAAMAVKILRGRLRGP